MLSRISGIFASKPAPPLSRFESTFEFKQLFPLLAELRKKEAELIKAATGKGIGSLDYRKQVVISQLIVRVNNLINEFNKLPRPESRENEVQEITKFIQDLEELIRVISEPNQRILSAKRNNYQDTYNSVISLGTYAGTFAAVNTLNVSTFGVLVAGLFVAPKVTESVSKLAGANDGSRPPDPTASVKLLTRITDTLSSIAESLGLDKNWKRAANGSEKDDSSAFDCPILFEKMTDPVVCTLDSRTYERRAITAWLAQHKTSPFNRAPLGNRAVESVLIPNRALKDAIDEQDRERNSKVLELKK